MSSPTPRVGYVPPVFVCGECGGHIARWPMLNLLKQEILDWRHVDVPDAWQDTPHRAVLGTPVPRVVLPEVETSDEAEPAPDPAPSPVVPARPAMFDELPSSARSLDKLAAENGWEVEAWYMRGPWMDARWRYVRTIETVVLRMRRDGVRLVATWDNTCAEDPDWSFAEGFVLTHTTDQAGSPDLRRLIKEPRQICETCGETSALHIWTDGAAICYRDTTAEQ